MQNLSLNNPGQVLQSAKIFISAVLSCLPKGCDDMIEVVYKEEKQEADGNEQFFHLPKNIRQIGEVNGDHKIYVEDYAFTYLGRIAGEDLAQGKIAILLGQSNWLDGVTYIFIRSALQIEGMEVNAEHISFTEEIWGTLNDEIQGNFPGQEIVGWMFSMPGFSMEITDTIYRTHLNYFGGNDKVLFLMEPAEREEAFFYYENGHMSKQKGYYIYYERNEPMQEYMIARCQNMPMEDKEVVGDKAVQDFRKTIHKKREEQEKQEQGKVSKVMYAASACLLIGVLAVGANYLNNFQKMKEARQNISAEGTVAKGDETEIPSSATVQAVLEEQKKQALSPTGTPTQQPGKESGNKEIAKQEEQKEDKTASGDEKAKGQQGSLAANEDSTAKGQESGEQANENNAQQPAETPQSASASSPEPYTIQPGDTLSKISKQRYGTMDMVEQICQMNNLSEEQIIYPGQKILLP